MSNHVKTEHQNLQSIGALKAYHAYLKKNAMDENDSLAE